MPFQKIIPQRNTPILTDWGIAAMGQYDAVKAELGDNAGELWAQIKAADGHNSGLDADTIDGIHGSEIVRRTLITEIDAYQAINAGTGVSVVSDSLAWSGQAVKADATVTGSVAQDIVTWEITGMRYGEYMARIRMSSNDKTTSGLLDIIFEYYDSSWRNISTTTIGGTSFDTTTDYEDFYVLFKFNKGSKLRLRIYWKRATSTHILKVESLSIYPTAGSKWTGNLGSLAYLFKFVKSTDMTGGTGASLSADASAGSGQAWTLTQPSSGATQKTLCSYVMPTSAMMYGTYSAGFRMKSNNTSTSNIVTVSVSYSTDGSTWTTLTSSTVQGTSFSPGNQYIVIPLIYNPTGNYLKFQVDVLAVNSLSVSLDYIFIQPAGAALYA